MTRPRARTKDRLLPGPVVRSFAPLGDQAARVLILGTVPSLASLAARQFYAHPRNAFWPIVGAVAGFDASVPYEERIEALKRARIAVWDVLRSCTREGSLDTSILAASEVPNDLARFFRTHPDLERVLVNGGTAWALYRRHVIARGIGTHLPVLRLPSTSPANASWSFERKLEAWRAAIAGR